MSEKESKKKPLRDLSKIFGDYERYPPKYDLSEIALENAMLEIQRRIEQEPRPLKGLNAWEAAQVLQCKEYWEFRRKNGKE